jgi:acyl carrier protein
MSSDDLATLTAELRAFIAGLGPVPCEELRDDVSLLDQGAVDSLGLVEIQLYLEDRLVREIEPDELARHTLVTITSIARWLAAAMHSSTPSGR